MNNESISELLCPITIMTNYTRYSRFQQILEQITPEIRVCANGTPSYRFYLSLCIFIFFPSS